MKRKRTRKPSLSRKKLLILLLGLFLAAFLVRFIYLNQLTSMPSFDSPVMDEGYHLKTAEQINSADGLPDDPYFRAPLYLYFLAKILLIAGGSLYWVRMVQILIGSLLPILVFFLGRRLFDPKIALISAAIAVIYPTFLYFDNSLLITSLMVILTTLLCLQLYRTEQKPTNLNFILSGLLLGLAALARPNVLLFGPALLIWLWLVVKSRIGLRQSLLKYALLAGATILVILPVTVRNYAVSGDFVLIAWQGGFNFYLGNNKDASGWSAGVSGIDRSWERSFQEPIAIAEKARGHALKRSEVSDYWYEKTFDDIGSDPGHFLALLGKKLRLLVNGEEIPNNQNIYMVREFVPIVKYLMFKDPLFMPYGLLLPLALAGIALTARQWRKYLLLYLLLGSYSLSLILFFVCARYRQPLIPILILFAVAAVSQLAGIFRKGKLFQGLLVIALVGLLMVDTNSSLLGGRDDYAEATDHYSLGVHLLQKQDLQGAEREFLQALDIFPDYARAYVDLGWIYRRTKSPEEALNYYNLALRADPSIWEAYLNIAEILNKMGRSEEALKVLEKARDTAPNNEFVRLELAQALYALGQQDRAEMEITEAMRINRDNPRVKRAYEMIMNQKATGNDVSPN
ncbi:MAG: tetratricopeptide repeat protein [bacterium]